VLVWNTIPSINATLPDFLIGQPDFDTVDFPGDPDEDAIIPTAGTTSGNRIYIPDMHNARIMVYELP
jgi:hypothetical protein